jgi:hypothetical protein
VVSWLGPHLDCSQGYEWVLISGVGKSAITIRFVTSQFYDRYVLISLFEQCLTIVRGYNPTIEDS